MEGFGVMADVDGFRVAVVGTREELDDDLRTRGAR